MRRRRKKGEKEEEEEMRIRRSLPSSLNSSCHLFLGLLLRLVSSPHADRTAILIARRDCFMRFAVAPKYITRSSR